MEENKTTGLNKNSTAQLHPVLLLREIYKKFIAIVLVAIMVMSCTYIFLNLTYQPRYRTKTTFVVSVRNGGASVYSNLSTTKGLAASLSQVLNSEVLKKQMAEDLGVERINGTIDTTLVEETNILEVRIAAPTPREAFLITSSLLNNYKPLVSDVLNNVVLDILQHPSVPVAPSNPLNLKKPIALAGAASVVAMMALLCVLAYLRDTVKTAEEAEEKLDTKTLGTVRHENKYKTLKSKIRHKKTSILITNPTTGFDFVETFRKLRTRIDYSMRKHNYKTLLVTSVMEDEGKSTIATNLALAMKKKYKNVMLIDIDLKKPSLHKILEHQQDEYATINDVVEGKVKLEDAMFVDEATGLHLLLGRNGTEDSMELIGNNRMKELINELRESMDVVVIDTPPMTVGPDTVNIAELVDAAVIVVRQDQSKARMINDMIDDLDEAHASLLGCILNDFRATEIDDNFSYGKSSYGYGKYGYGKYGYGKYGYSKYGYSKYGYSKYGYGKYGYGYGYGHERSDKHSRHDKEES